MAQDKHPFFSLMGWNAQGDLDGLTFYVSKRRGLVFFKKSPPEKPPSPLQLRMRNRFRLIATLWRSLPADTRDAWHRLAIAARLRIHGYDLFVYHQMSQDAPAIQTLERQTGVDVHV